MHAEFADVFIFLKDKNYPKKAISKDDKSSFRRKTKPFIIENNELYHLGESDYKQFIFLYLFVHYLYLYFISNCLKLL